MPKATAGLPFFGERMCIEKKQNGEACENKAYYYNKYQRPQRSTCVFCGVHCKPFERVKLPRNPNAAKLREEALEQHKLTIDVVAAQNKVNGKHGSVTCEKMRMMKPVELKEGVLNVFPNNKHQTRNDGFGCCSLSPMRLGPVGHGQHSLPSAETVENYHQFNKCFPIEMDDEGNPLPEFYIRRLKAYMDPVPHRHKFDSAAIKKMNKDFVTGGESLVNKPMFSVHFDRDGCERRYTYVQSRFFYCKWYEKLAMKTQDFATLKQKLHDGVNLCICGYDAYQPEHDLYEHYIDSSKPYGHELVLYTLLVVDNKKDYPWNIFYKANKDLYDPLSFTF